MDCSLPGSSIHGIFQARVLEWGAIALSDLTDDSLTIMCIEIYYVAVALPADFFHTSCNLILSTIGSVSLPILANGKLRPGDLRNVPTCTQLLIAQ